MAAVVTWTIGDLVKKLMDEAGLTQQQLAEKVGVAVNTVGNIIRGQTREPDKNTLDKIAQELGRSTPELWTMVDTLNGRVPLPPANVVPMPNQPPAQGDRRKSEFSLRARDFGRRYDALSGHQQLALDAVLSSFEQINDAEKKKP